MKTINASTAKHRLNKIIDETAVSNRPVGISGRAGRAVLVPRKMWNSTMETLYLCSMPGVRESIIEGVKTPVKDLSARISF